MEIEISGWIILCDEIDLKTVQEHTWSIPKIGSSAYNHMNGNVAPTTKIWYGRKRYNMFMHRLILGLTPNDGVVIDHINGNRRDNRRENLRICSNKENSRNTKTPKSNTSGYKGVSWVASQKVWRASIGVDNTHIYLGAFATKEVAARMYDIEAMNRFGEFARINFRKEDYTEEMIQCVLSSKIITPTNRADSGYRGVYKHKRDHNWYISVSVNKTKLSSGGYKTPEEAASAYDLLALKYQGSRAITNFSKDKYSDDEIKNAKPREVFTTLANTSGYRGVSFHRNIEKWCSCIQHNKIMHYLGSFRTDTQAAKAYDRKALELLGDKAKLNFPKENYTEGATR